MSFRQQIIEELSKGKSVKELIIKYKDAPVKNVKAYIYAIYSYVNKGAKAESPRKFKKRLTKHDRKIVTLTCSHCKKTYEIKTSFMNFYRQHLIQKYWICVFCNNQRIKIKTTCLHCKKVFTLSLNKQVTKDKQEINLYCYRCAKYLKNGI